MQHQKILILDFGGQYNQLIARRVRDLKVYCDLLPCDMTAEEIKKYGPIGIIFTGGPNSVYEAHAPRIERAVLELGIPVLGICYGAQLIAHTLGGSVTRADTSEYGKRTLFIEKDTPMSEGIPQESICWMSHTDFVASLPAGFMTLAKTDSCPVAMYGSQAKRIYGIQFHPEVVHSEYGNKLLENFLYRVCGAKGDWTRASSTSRWKRSAQAWGKAKSCAPCPAGWIRPSRPRSSTVPSGTGSPACSWITACTERASRSRS